ncbi:hypothetical protein KIM67_08880 [Flagellimonas sp. 389]|uniref:hypothetical protein n=1 Tax=Flagellimonas sp. 389 TaxID=2835862 RepID=UPI001BD537E2|nr:hypothetical protein [Flagellimonas sp. 389]MBS9462523.1 hypothetical protein [Flagellimonas sp. 389]
MKTVREDKTIKIKPLYRLLVLGITQLYGAFVIFRLGVLVIKELWINTICAIAALGLVLWGFYILYNFLRIYKVKERKIILRDETFVLFGSELSYADVENVTINNDGSELAMDIHLRQLEKPIPLVAVYMQLKEFHEIYKTLVNQSL